MNTLRSAAMLAALVLLGVAPASAHGGQEISHLSVHVGPIGAKQEKTFELAFEGGPFTAGWLFLAYGGVQSSGAPLEVELYHESGFEPVAKWTWAAGSFHLNMTKLPKAGFYVLDIYNPGNDEAQYAFYFDQSCNCLDKSIGLDDGYGLFNFEIPAGRDVDLSFVLGQFDTTTNTLNPPQGVRVLAWAATLENDRALWPDDFRILSTAESKAGLLDISFQTKAKGTHYVMVQVVEGAQPSKPVYMRPTLEVKGGSSPDLAPLAILAALGVAAMLMRNR
jgi:hypothetical protein